jgi:hypothetical protein
LANRAGHHCSNPSCQRLTTGPDGDDGHASIGVAAHITAASIGGPRYNSLASAEERSDSSNGIWLCQTCSRLVDTDIANYTIEVLQEWKAVREASAALELRGLEVRIRPSFQSLETKIPDLVAEMREDIGKNPFTREFVCLKKSVTFWYPETPLFTYHFEDHPQLLGKLQIMENAGAIYDSAVNNVPRYRLEEEFVDYLTRS